MKKITTSKKFSNWAGNIKFTAPLFAQPATEEELIELIKQHKHIRLVGSGHSWSNLFETDELLLNLDNYNKVLHLDRTNKTITVQSGIKLWQMNEYLDQQGLALINLGSIERQSIAGAICTGTHGTGHTFQCLASQVLSFSLILSDGTKWTLQKDTELFNACVINIGVLGVVSQITLQVTDAFRLREKTYTSSFKKVIEELDILLENNDHLKIWWLPPSKNVVVFTYERTQAARNDSRWRQIFQDEIISVFGYRFLVGVGNIFPKLRPAINELLTSQFRRPLDRIEKSYKVFKVPEPPKHRETEWAFDLKCARKILFDYKEMFTNTRYTFNFIQEIRFTKGDNFWLSECYGRDTLWIGTYNLYDHQWKDILKDFEQFGIQNKGRPHWGKEFSVGKDYLEQQYDKFQEFVALKEKLDPRGKFQNKWTKQIFEG
jgi:hypothetical protein